MARQSKREPRVDELQESVMHRSGLLAQTPNPSGPEPDGEPHKVPVEPPAEPPNPNPVHVPPGGPRPGDLPSSNPDVIARRAQFQTLRHREHRINL